MNLKYKIIEVYPSEHSIVVRFYTDKITEQDLATDVLGGVIRRGRTDYNITLPVPAPTGEALHAFITRHAPVDWLATKEAIADPAVDTTLAAVKALMGVEHAPAPPAPAAPPALEFPVDTGEL